MGDFYAMADDTPLNRSVDDAIRWENERVLRELAEERFEVYAVAASDDPGAANDPPVATARTYADAQQAARHLLREGGYAALAVHDRTRPSYPALAILSLLPDGRINTNTGDHARYAEGR